jgi:hypothetical protein
MKTNATGHSRAKRSRSDVPRVGHLLNLAGIMREMANVYRECRTGKTSPELGCKLIYMLRELRETVGALELSELSARLDELAQIAERRYGKEADHPRYGPN